MKLKDKFLRLVSKIVPWKLGTRYRVTVGDIEVSKSLADSPIEHPLSNITPRYSLKRDCGGFELITLNRKGKGVVVYEVRHSATGTAFSVTEVVFQLLFQNSRVRK